MPRNASGTYTLPLTAVVTQTTITSTWANSTTQDLRDEMTDSLSRSGEGGMLAQLKSIDGTAAAPGMAFADELGSGVYRVSAGIMGLSISGVQVATVAATEFAMTNAAGPSLQNQAATATNPTLVPNQSDPDTGMGWTSSNVGTLVAGGSQVVNWNATRFAVANSTGAAMMNEATSSTNPTLIPNISDTNTGIGSASSDNVSVIAGGLEKMRIGAYVNFYADMNSSDAAGPAIQNEAATSTNPTLLPNKADGNTGIGWNTANTGTLVGGGVEAATWTSTRFAVGNGSGAAMMNEAASSTNPTLVPNVADPTSGVGQNTTGAVSLISSSVEKMRIATVIEAHVNIYADDAAGPGFMNEVATSYNPTLVPNRANPRCGVGWTSTNIGTLVSDNTEVMNWSTGRISMAASAGPSLLNEDASSTNPTLAPNRTNPSTGIGWNTTNVGSIIAGGAEVASWSSAGITMRSGFQMLVHDGSVTAPPMAFANDTNTGVAPYAANAGGLVAAGAWAAIWQADQFTINGLDGLPQLNLRRDDNSIVSGNGIGRVSAVSTVDDATTINSVAQIRAVATEDHTTTEAGTQWEFYTTADGTATINATPALILGQDRTATFASHITAVNLNLSGAIYNTISNDVVSLCGDTATNTGSRISLYGSGVQSKADDIDLVSANVAVMSYDASASSWVVSADVTSTTDWTVSQLTAVDALIADDTLAVGGDFSASASIVFDGMASGADQVLSGAGVGELWHDTTDDTIKMGV